jgi:hypothetical protein
MKTIKIQKNGRPATHSELCKAAGIPEHTPAPWEILDKMNASGDMFILTDKPNEFGNFIIADITRNGDPVTAEDKANARLIAAAPELLNALKEIAKRAYDGSMCHGAAYAICDSITDIAYEAIAKAGTA